MSAPVPLPRQVLTPEDQERIRTRHPKVRSRYKVPCTCIGGWDDGPNGDPVRCTRCIGSPGWIEVER